jgi:hypothetical protein
LFAEVLAVGVMVAVSCLGVVTVLGALAAGCASLREYLEHDRPVGPRRYVSLLREALRGPVVLLAPPALCVVAGLDVLAWRAGMPGGKVLGPAALAVALAALTVGVRAAAAWQGSSAWPDLIAESARESVADWHGTLLIAGAVVACVALGVELPVLLPVLPGLLALAAVAVRRRARG